MIAIAHAVVILCFSPGAKHHVEFRAGDKVIYGIGVVVAGRTTQTAITKPKIIATQSGNCSKPIIPVDVIFTIQT